MRKIYENLDFTHVGYYQSILEEAGIPTHIKNLGASSVMGEVPFTEVYPELWVVRDEDYERALDLLKPYDTAKPDPAREAAPWVCPACGSKVDGVFTECWNCGTDKPGNDAREHA